MRRRTFCALCRLPSRAKPWGLFHTKKNQPWLDAVPFGHVCQVWQLTNFNLMRGSELIFPCPRLSKMGPANEDAVDLQSTNEHEDCYSQGMSKHPRIYHPQAGTAPLCGFCELQTILPARLLRDLEFLTPEGPMAKKLSDRFREILSANLKTGKRKLGEFCKDGYVRSYIIMFWCHQTGRICACAQNSSMKPRMSWCRSWKQKGQLSHGTRRATRPFARPWSMRTCEPRQ